LQARSVPAGGVLIRTAAPIAVAMFNANTVQVTVTVNNGMPFTIGPTSAAIRFRPQVPAVQPQFVQGPPTPGTFGIGSNRISITHSTWPAPQYFQCTIPLAIQMQSLQVYIFWNSDTPTGSCWAIFLNNGQVFNQCSGQTPSCT
jgi:hypothetical protein